LATDLGGTSRPCRISLWYRVLELTCRSTGIGFAAITRVTMA
jgi:hypothetical protein